MTLIGKLRRRERIERKRKARARKVWIEYQITIGTRIVSRHPSSWHATGAAIRAGIILTNKGRPE